MDPDFWRARWRKGEIGFHQDKPSWALEHHGARLSIGGGAHVLVPLSGKSRDLLWLAQAGAAVRAAELVDDAVKAFHAENGLDPLVTPDGAHVRYDAGDIVTWSGDFFALRADQVGRIEAVFDRAAMIALPLELRSKYVEQVKRLAPGARILLVTIDYDPAQREGPPFPVRDAEVLAAYAGAAIEKVEVRDVLEELPRFAAAGCTWVTETVWFVDMRA